MGKVKVRDHLKNLGLDAKLINIQNWKPLIGFIWLRIGTSGGLL